VGKGAHSATNIDTTLAAPLPTMPHSNVMKFNVMPQYVRARIEGGVYFFTVTLADRSGDLLVRHIEHLRKVYKVVEGRHPFKTIAICVLPDHVHAVWSLPSGDSNFPVRWSQIKSAFSRVLPATDVRSESKAAKRDKGIWQRRYWEHVIRNETDLEHHVEYIHYNPVKHGLVSRVRDWPYSSFHRYVARGDLPIDWGGDLRELMGEFGE
jgi:putative transposase